MVPVVQSSLSVLGQRVESSTKALGAKIDRLNQELGETKAKIEAAGKIVSEVADARAREIDTSLGYLATALTEAGNDFRTASEQSSRLGRRLNWLTCILVSAGLISAAATAFYAWETKRLVDLTEQQLQRTRVAPQR